MTRPKLQTMAGKKARLMVLPAGPKPVATLVHETGCTRYDACSNRGPLDCNGCTKIKEK